MQVTLAKQIEFLNKNATFVAVQQYSSLKDDTVLTFSSLIKMLREKQLVFIRINEPKSCFASEYKQPEYWLLGFILEKFLVKTERRTMYNTSVSNTYLMPLTIQYYLKQYAACMNYHLWGQFEFNTKMGIPNLNITNGMCYRRVPAENHAIFDTQQCGASFLYVPEDDRLELYYGDFPCKV